MAWDNGKAEEAERLAGEIDKIPTAAEMQKQQQEKLEKQQAANLDRNARVFAVEQATRACAAGGYEVKAILDLVDGFYRFVTTTKEDAGV